MKIGFITDLHIDNEGILPFDVDVRLRIQRVISYLKNKNYDLIIFGGDLCNIEGNIEIYEWLKKQMDEVDVSYHIIAGNHDDQFIFHLLRIQRDLHNILPHLFHILTK